MTIFLTEMNKQLTLRETVDAITDQWDTERPSPRLETVRNLVEGESAWRGTEEDLFELVSSLDIERPSNGGPTLNDFYRARLSEILPRMNGGPELNQYDFAHLTSALEDGPGIENVDMDETSLAVNGPLGTTGMEPCVAVGVTGTYQGSQYSALSHWAPGTRSPAAVFSDLDEVFSRSDSACPSLSDLNHIQYFAIGGSQETLKDQVELLEYMHDNNLNRTVVRLTNEPEWADRTKTVVLDPRGQIGYGVSGATATATATFPETLMHHNLIMGSVADAANREVEFSSGRNASSEGAIAAPTSLQSSPSRQLGR